MRIKITDVIVYMMFSLLTIMFVPVLAHASQEQSVTVQNSKIDPTLQTVMDAAAEDELISVYLELSEVESLQIDELIASVESPEEKLAIIQEAYAAIADEFLERHFDESERDRILFQSGYTTEVVEKVEKVPMDDRGLLNSYRTVTKYTSTMAVQATKEEILAYAMDDDVTVLSLYGFIPEPSVVLTEAKATAKVELTYYKEATQYREAQQAELQEIIKTGFADIEEAETVDEVRAAVEKAEAKMDKVKTDKQLREEEVANQKPGDKEQPDNSDGNDNQQKDDQKDSNTNGGNTSDKDNSDRNDGSTSDKNNSDKNDGSTSDKNNPDKNDGNTSDKDNSDRNDGSTSDKNNSDKNDGNTSNKDASGSDRNDNSSLPDANNPLNSDTTEKPSDQGSNAAQEMDATGSEQKDTDVSNETVDGNNAANGNKEHYYDASGEQLEQELDDVQKMTNAIRSYVGKIVIIGLFVLVAAAGYGIWIHKKK